MHIEMDLILIVFRISTSNFEIVQKAHLDITVTTLRLEDSFFSFYTENTALTLTHRYVVYSISHTDTL